MANTACHPVTSRWRRRRRILLVSLLILVGLVWAAPRIVAATGLRDHVLAYLFSRVDGSIATRDASLAWLAPVELTDVTVTDRTGTTLLTIGKLRSERTLLQLILDP